MAHEAPLSYEPLRGERHRHLGVEHSHPHRGPHTHAWTKRPHHGHSHGLIDESIKRSREGPQAVSISLGVLVVAATAQTLVFALSGSVALLADLIHNFGDALTAMPLGVAFLMRSARAERNAGLAVVAAVFISACVVGIEAVLRLIHSVTPGHLAVLAAAGAIGFAGDWIAGLVTGREPIVCGVSIPQEGSVVPTLPPVSLGWLRPYPHRTPLVARRRCRAAGHPDFWFARAGGTLSGCEETLCGFLNSARVVAGRWTQAGGGSPSRTSLPRRFRN
jgi:hypothetical protein